MKKSILATTGLALSITMMPDTAQASCGDISISEMNWASSQVVTSVSKFLLEQGYGCTVQTVPTSSVPAVTSVAETGKPDIVTELWLNSAALYSKLEAEGKVITAAKVLSDGGVDGWWVPKYLVEKHPELKTLDGVLANPELVGGRFHNYPEGWAARIRNDNLFKAFHFSDKKMSVFNHGSGETLAASIAAAYEAKEPWFGSYWAPTSVLGKYEMVEVDLGEFDSKAYDCITSKECSTPQKTSLPASTVITAVTTDLAERAPDVFELMQNVTFTNALMGKLLAWQEKNKASSEETAVHFLTSQQDVWSKWINDDARNNLSMFLK